MFGSIGWQEILIIGLLGVLLFGRRLPEVGKNLGRSFVEFKKGLSGMDEELKAAKNDANRIARDADDAVRNAGTQSTPTPEPAAAEQSA